MTRAIAPALKCLLVAAFGIILYATDQPFLMIGGSDSTSFLFAPTLPIQIICALVLAGAFFWPVRRVRVVLLILALPAALQGGHRLVVDNLHGEIRDVILGVPLQTLTLNPAIEGGLSLHATAGGFRIGQPEGGRTVWIFSPRWIGFDPGALVDGADPAPQR